MPIRKAKPWWKSSLHCFLIACLVVCFGNDQNNHAHAASLIPDPIIHFSVGAVAGGMGAVAAYPFDYIKSQMQTEYGARQYKNGWDAFTSTIQENPWNLYRGVGVQVLGVAPEKGIKLGVNDVLLSSFLSTLGGLPLWAQIVSGGVAGACQVIVTSPLEVLKVGLQTSDMKFEEVWKQVDGFKGLYRGVEVVLLRDILFSAVCFPLYATLVDSSVNSFAAGAIAGVVASAVATPPDVIKTRILSQDGFTRSRQSSSTGTPTTIESNPVESSMNSLAAGTVVGVATAAVTPLEVINTPMLGRDKLSQSLQSRTRVNPIALGFQIVQQEGPAVLLSGMNERCLGAIPRFGTILAMHDALEHFVSSAGWLSHVSL